MIKRMRIVSLFLMICVFLVPVLAQDSGDAGDTSSASESDTSESDAFEFDSLEEDLFGSEDDIFGSEDELIEEIPEVAEGESEAYLEFLSSDEVQIGGSLRSSMSSYWGWQNIPGDSAEDRLAATLAATVYLNARPSSDLRIFMKGRIEYPFETVVSGLLTGERTIVPPPVSYPATGLTNVNTVNISIFELYSDVNLDQKLFFRFGKQTVNWGVGYFWSPADFISLVPIDLEDPSAEREGPLALKATLPFDLHSIEAYIISGIGVRRLEDLGLAARANFYFDFGDFGLETQLGLGYQKDRPFRLMTALRLPLQDFNLFLEGRVSFGREGQKIVSARELEEDKNAYFSGTLGFNFNKADIFESILDFSLTAQYYFHGEGYDDSSLLSAALGHVVSGGLPASALETFGKHYTALSLGINELFIEDLSISTLWRANWSDLSGIINTRLTLRLFKGFSAGFGVIAAYGEDPSEYWVVAGKPSSKNPFGRLAFELTFTVGGGQF